MSASTTDDYSTSQSQEELTIKKPENLVTKDLDKVICQFHTFQLTDQFLLLLQGFLLGIVSWRHKSMLAKTYIIQSKTSTLSTNALSLTNDVIIIIFILQFIDHNSTLVFKS